MISRFVTHDLPMNVAMDSSCVIGRPVSVSSAASTRFEVGSESTSTPSQSQITLRITASLLAVKVTVRLFAQLRERAGRSEVEVELPEGALVRDAIAALDDVAAGLPVVMAINREYADESAALSAGDELAQIGRASCRERV